MSQLSKKTLEYLAELARIEISDKRQGTSDKLLKDLQNILGYFEELKEADTENIEPMAGGTIEENIFREDEESSKFKVQSSKLTEAFPEKQNGFLKVPPIFD
jgi:aspartyl-tRNA(Asn)/glutamyl-tRNA(Gln) amidotransferase subunit C